LFFQSPRGRVGNPGADQGASVRERSQAASVAGDSARRAGADVRWAGVPGQGIRVACLFSATATLVGVRLAVGDVVVYPAYGVGRVAAREKRVVLGAAQEILVLELADGLSVTLPVERGRELLRPLLSQAGLRRVQETLREDHTLSEDVWLKRRKDTQVKLAGGDPLRLAEVVRDCARRERRMKAKHTGSRLSPSERDLYLRARRLLSGEIGQARGLEPLEADSWIEEQLTTTA
jgi:CarD family transcriptional regulator